MNDEPTLYENDVEVYGWVIELQRLLGDRGFPNGDPDGEFRSGTRTAVEGFQRASGCDPDGIVGNQTWAALRGGSAPEGIRNEPFGDTRDLDTGLARDEAVDGYVDDAYGTVYSSMSAQDRAEALMVAANEQLVAAGVPALKFPPTWGASGSTWATFTFRSWTLDLNPANFDPTYYDTLSADDQNDVAETIYHEARHAEQWFRMARERAGLGATQADLEALGHPSDIAAAAIADPIMQCDQSQYEAEEWFESVYGAGRTHRNTTLGDPSAPYDDYRALPEERDAWGVGTAVEREFDDRPTP
jgi:Putative peptidoglycan binding domain